MVHFIELQLMCFMWWNIAPDNWGVQINIFLFLHENIWLLIRRDPSSEYPRHVILWRIKKNINSFWFENVPYLELWEIISWPRWLSWKHIPLVIMSLWVPSRLGWQHSFMKIDHEIISRVILTLPLIQEGQLSVSGKIMRTVLVNRLED